LQTPSSPPASLAASCRTISEIVQTICDYTGDSRITINQISEKTFDDIAETPELEGGLGRFYYDTDAAAIIVCGDHLAPIHESTLQFFVEVATTAQNCLNTVTSCRVLMDGTSKADLYLDIESKSPSFKGKQPDVSFMVIVDGNQVSSPYPTIVVEVGYSDTYDMLVKDVDAWLLGSLGYIRCAILIKLEKPAIDDDFGDIAKWTGFIEVYHLEAVQPE
jgi:hypothetical protein